MSRAAVIVNPVKISDTLRRELSDVMQARGWDEGLWLETLEDDPGHAMAREALSAGVDLVITAGGDGTVRVVAGELAETGVAMGLIPSGTGNLLARNLGIPLTQAEAVELALSDHRRRVDLVKVTADDQQPQWSAVMTGCGLDAMIMENTDSTLKAKIGPAAYFVAAAQQIGRLPVKMTVQIDDERPFHRQAVICLAANVGSLTGGLELLPDADPSDGELNILIASPHRITDLLRVIVRVLLRHRRPDKSLDRITARKMVVRIRGGDEFEIDGDSAGRCERLETEVVPGALLIAAPPTGD